MGPFGEQVLPVTSFPIQEIQLPPEPTQGQEKEGIPGDKTFRCQDDHAPISGPAVQFSCFAPWDSETRPCTVDSAWPVCTAQAWGEGVLVCGKDCLCLRLSHHFSGPQRDHGGGGKGGRERAGVSRQKGGGAQKGKDEAGGAKGMGERPGFWGSELSCGD